jgi:hypothetical protein
VCAEREPTTTTGDGVFSVRTAILEHLVDGSAFEVLRRDDAWLWEEELDPLLAVCREAPGLQAVADELAYILIHLGDDVIHGRRVYVLRGGEFGQVELVAQSATTDDLLLISRHPVRGVRVDGRGVGAFRETARTYVDGGLVRGASA